MSGFQEIGFGGSCHWCTEAIFRSLRGVTEVKQGWISPSGSVTEFSEAVIVTFNPELIPLQTLIEIHLYTHSCTSKHAMRSKYRSAMYTFHDDQMQAAGSAISLFQMDFADPIITEILPFGDFKLNRQEYLDYYYSNPDKPFCKTFIDPKIRVLLNRFSALVKQT